MNWKKLVWLMVFFAIGSGIFLYYELARPVRYRKFVHRDMVSKVPQWIERKYKKNNWEGFVFTGGGGIFRVLWKEVPQSEAEFNGLVKSLQGYRYKFVIPLYSGGEYFVKKNKKGIKIVVVFYKPKRVFWIDMVTGTNTRKYKEIVDNFLLNLKINGVPVSEEARNKIMETDRKISPFFIIDELWFPVIDLAIFAFIIFLMVFVFKIYGRCPQIMDAIICSPMSTIQEKTAMKNRINTCCVCLKGDKIIIYEKGKQRYEINLSALGEEFYRKGKIKISDNVKIWVNNFKAWKPYLPVNPDFHG